ncbi:MAG: hypothetical protein AAB483_02855 [Patescibacteria group bacterium]
MPGEQHTNTEGWHVVLALLVLVVLCGYLYYQAGPQIQNGEKKDPLEFFGIPRASRPPFASPSPTPVKVQ